MNDLISRSELNDVINELEIYADGRPNTSKVEVSVLQLRRWINKLKNIPTAYDINKVVKEMEYEREDAPEDEDYWSWACAIDKAIGIVKAGVKNEN